MKKILIFIFTILSLSAVAQKKIGSKGVTHIYFGEHEYFTRPTYGPEDSLALQVRQEFLDSCVAIASRISGGGITTGTIDRVAKYVTTSTVGESSITDNGTDVRFANGGFIFDASDGYSRFLSGLGAFKYQSNLSNNVQHYFQNAINTSHTNGAIVYVYTGTINAASGDVPGIQIEGTANQSSTSTQTMPFLKITPDINQSGSPTGIIHGIYYNPTLTSVISPHRAIETTSGDVLLGTSSGRVGVGGVTSPAALLHIGAGSSSLSPLKFNAGAPTTSPSAGQMQYNTGLWIIDSSGSRRDTIATRSWVRLNAGGTSQVGGFDTLYYNRYTNGTGLQLVFLRGDTFYTKDVLFTNGLTPVQNNDSTITAKLGGTLIENTDINGFENTYNFSLSTMNNIVLEGQHTKINGGDLALRLVEDNGGTLTLGLGVTYVFTGTTTTWTLPALTGNIGRTYWIKNAGSGNITLQRAGSDQIYETSAVTSITIAAGTGRKVSAGTMWWVQGN